MTDEPTKPRRLEEVMSDNDIDTRHTVSESADKITVTTNTKRGSGTRDEDKIRVKVKGDDPDDVVDKLNQTLLNLHNETAAELRNNQPEQRHSTQFLTTLTNGRFRTFRTTKPTNARAVSR